MKISVITPVFNGELLIKDCMKSVADQTFQNKEHIIIDGLSYDNTVGVIQKFGNDYVKLLSEKDRGLYDAFNKGIELAGGDVVCFLCADDMYAHENVLQTIASAFGSLPEADIIYGDILYVERSNLSKIVRYWKSAPFKQGLFQRGWLPPNTAVFIRRQVFEKYGIFNLKFKMAADYELHFRLFEKHKLKSIYLPGIIARMRSGGVSNANIKNMYHSLKECYEALLDQGVRFPLIYIINTLFYRLRQTVVPFRIKKWNQEQLTVMSQPKLLFGSMTKESKR